MKTLPPPWSCLGLVWTIQMSCRVCVSFCVCVCPRVRVGRPSPSGSNEMLIHLVCHYGNHSGPALTCPALWWATSTAVKWWWSVTCKWDPASPSSYSHPTSTPSSVERQNKLFSEECAADSQPEVCVCKESVRDAKMEWEEVRTSV